MTRKLLYQNMLNDILERFTALQDDSDEYLDIFDEIVNGNIPVGINLLLAEPSLCVNVKPWLNTMRDSFVGGTATQDISDIGYEVALFQNHPDSKYIRPFFFASTELTVFSSRNLFIDDAESYDPTLWSKRPNLGPGLIWLR